MLFMKYTFLVLVSIILVVACKKEDPEEECCPDVPEEEEFKPYAYFDVNGIPTRFGEISLELHDDWILLLENDTMMIRLNLGDGDTLGFRPLKSDFSEARLHNVEYKVLGESRLLFTEVDKDNKRLSFFCQAKLGMSEDAQWYNPLDTLTLTNGDFEYIPW